MWKRHTFWALVALLSIAVHGALVKGLPTSGEPAPVDNDEYDDMHPQLAFNMFRGANQADHSGKRTKRGPLPLKFSAPTLEKYGNYWTNDAQSSLQRQLQKNRLNKKRAKNAILFIGDGMSIPTLTATRVYMGGENKQLSFEQFPYAGLSKTYCANTQVADSACSATAYLSGVKANYATLGLTAAVPLGDCMGENNTAYHVPSIMAWAQAQKMATGLVTTTEVTNASPAGVYAHSANRNWENDQILIRDGADPDYCTDIAKQLIYGEVGRHLNVIMGGGRQNFLPTTKVDRDGHGGKRGDNVNLLEEWQRLHEKTGTFVDTKDKLDAVDPLEHSHVLGLFSSGHMPFHLEREANVDRPTLEEMMSKALDVLEQNENGYILFVEGGRIDHGHHKTQAQRALDETVELHKAVQMARKRASEEDTLIVVTSDHSHTMAMAGYSSRGNDILGINNAQDGLDQLPYATLSYANGPGYTELAGGETGGRKNLRLVDMHTQTFMFPSTIPLKEETHGGDDVAVFASGPWAHLFSGTYEQNLIPHAMAYAACIGNGLTSCAEN